MSHWKLVKQRYAGIENITPADRHLVQQHWQVCHANKLRPPRDSIKMLFALYHKYVYKNPADEACGACVQFIYNYWKQKIQEWEP